MRYKVSNIKLKTTYCESDIIKAISKMSGLAESDITEMKIIGKSLDARKKDGIVYVFTCSFCVPKSREKTLNSSDLFTIEKERTYTVFQDIDCGFLAKDALSRVSAVDNRNTACMIDNKRLNIDNADCVQQLTNKSKSAKAEMRPIIVGSGPAGLFCAMILAEKGLRPIIIEQGEEVSKRAISIDKFWQGGKLNTMSNVQFGEGGAGTFSDGKLNTGINNELCYFVLERFVKFGAPQNILYDAKPHIGTDILIKVVANIREYIESMGGEYRFETKLTDVIIKNGEAKSIICNNCGKIYEMDVDTLILAIGHSSRETFYMLDKKGIKMENKPFAVGVRVEHLQSDIDRAQYGKDRHILGLPPADYKLAVNLSNGRGVYSFCMCPGGYVVASSSEEGGIVVNGMSYNARDGENANSAIICTVHPSDFGDKLFCGVEFQRELEQSAFNLSNSYKAPCQRLGDFMKNKESKDFTYVKPSYKADVVKSDINKILPKFISESIKEAFPLFGRKIKGFDNENAILTGVETRTSCPIRINRDEFGMCNIVGVFPVGEGAGYAGGITSSAVDGIKTAIKIIKRKCGQK